MIFKIIIELVFYTPQYFPPYVLQPRLVYQSINFISQK